MKSLEGSALPDGHTSHHPDSPTDDPNRMVAVPVDESQLLDGETMPFRKLPPPSGLSILANAAAVADQRDNSHQTLLLQLARYHNELQHQKDLVYRSEAFRRVHQLGSLSLSESLILRSQLQSLVVPEVPSSWQPAEFDPRRPSTSNQKMANNSAQANVSSEVIIDDKSPLVQGKRPSMRCHEPEGKAAHWQKQASLFPQRPVSSSSSSSITVALPSGNSSNKKLSGTDGNVTLDNQMPKDAASSKRPSSSSWKASSSPVNKKNMRPAPLIITETTDEDVLCIRSRGKLYDPPGNQAFRNIAQDHAHTYVLAQNKSEKTRVINSVIAQVQGTGGRFLRRVDDDHDMGVGVTWVLLNKRETVQKTRDLLIRLCSLRKKRGV